MRHELSQSVVGWGHVRQALAGRARDIAPGAARCGGDFSDHPARVVGDVRAPQASGAADRPADGQVGGRGGRPRLT